MFPEHIEERYWVVKTNYSPGESEYTLPLGSWRKGRGLAGKRGHVYVKGDKEAGVWLIFGNVTHKLAELIAEFPTIKTMQCGDGEATFSIPWSDLDGLLPRIWAKRRSTSKGASPEALAKARASSPIGKPR